MHFAVNEGSEGVFVSRIELSHRCECYEGLVITLNLKQGQTTTVQCVYMVGFYGECFIAADESFALAPHHAECDSAIGNRIGVVRIEGNCSVEVSNGFVVTPQFH